LEAACKKALSYTAAPGYKSIQNILAAGKEGQLTDQSKASESTTNKYSITRGAGYYGR
jgi:hypothetical protein